MGAARRYGAGAWAIGGDAVHKTPKQAYGAEP